MPNPTALLPAPRRFAGWFAVALLLHATLLLVPYRAPEIAAPALAPLRLALSAAVARPSRLETLPPPPAVASAPEPPRDTLAAESPAAPVPSADANVEMPPREDAPAAENVDATTLVEAVRRFERERAQPSRQLGVPGPYATPPNWRAAPLSESNRFDGMVAPPEVRVVDRWLAADGSHNVVIETPGGETLCGRAEAWDPMRPMVEHVMAFRRCGGGGERTFEVPDRYRRTR